MIKDLIFYFYGYVVFFYSMGLIISYVILMWLAEIGIFRKKRGPLSLYTKQIIEKSPYTPGVSIIAPAYNRGAHCREQRQLAARAGLSHFRSRHRQRRQHRQDARSAH